MFLSKNNYQTTLKEFLCPCADRFEEICGISKWNHRPVAKNRQCMHLNISRTVCSGRVGGRLQNFAVQNPSVILALCSVSGCSSVPVATYMGSSLNHGGNTHSVVIRKSRPNWPANNYKGAIQKF